MAGRVTVILEEMQEEEGPYHGSAVPLYSAYPWGQQDGLMCIMSLQNQCEYVLIV